MTDLLNLFNLFIIPFITNNWEWILFISLVLYTAIILRCSSPS